MSQVMELWDYRRRVAEIYREVRQGRAPEEGWTRWRTARDRLFAEHPQSAVPPEARSAFTGLAYFPYDPGWRTIGKLVSDPDAPADLQNSDTGTSRFLRFGHVDFQVAGHSASLDIFWLDAYGGGVFLPFRDATNGITTYGGGRYLLDTVKGADLGHSGNEIVLDFNYAYHPSCVHSHQWSCPLSPAANTLPFPVTAGERLP